MGKDKFLDFVRNTDARTDQNFELYGVLTDSLTRLFDPADRALLAVGLKGVGKTAAFKLLSTAKGADIVRAINAECLQASEGARQKPTLQYLPEVRTELLLQAISDLAEKVESDKAFARRLPKDVHQRVLALRGQVWEKLKNLAGEIGGVSILGFGVTRRASSRQEDKPFKPLTSFEHDEALDIVKGLQGMVNFRCVIDDPEAIFTASDGMNLNMVAAVCMAANDLNAASANFRTIILLKPNIVDALIRVDEFVNIPRDRRVRLSWTREELKAVVVKRAEIAKFDLSEIFRPSPEELLDLVVNDSRTGPRDVLNRLVAVISLRPDKEVIDPADLEETSEQFAEACYEQMLGAYDRQYQGLSRASLILFEGKAKSLDKAGVQVRFDQMIASDVEFIGFKDEEWARSSSKFLDLLVQFGLVAIRVGESTILPYESSYYDCAKTTDAVFTFLPGLRAKVKGLFAPAKAKPASSRRR